MLGVEACSSLPHHQHDGGNFPGQGQARHLRAHALGQQEYDARMEKIARERYPHVALLKQVQGVGTQIALTYVLTLDDPQRFPKSREVGCFLGLRPGRRDSGESQPQMHISKEGDPYLRTMLVQGAHYILGPFTGE
jgi:transposase